MTLETFTCPRRDFETHDPDEYDDHLKENFGY